MSTIFALSSGAPPAAIGVLRISGPDAGAALTALTGSLPPARQASLRTIRDAGGAVLDSALVLWFPGPGSATGEDCAELHCHGGRAVIRAIEMALAAIPGLERAAPGAFTRRAFANGRIDLAEAEGLADLLSAETELQRRAAQAQAGGALSRAVGAWRDAVLRLSAMVEASLDFSDEDDAATLGANFAQEAGALARSLQEGLDRPAAERLRDGLRVVLAGPPNSGKSTLFNALVESEAAIVSPIAGTTRDAIERPIAIDGVPFVLVDTAGVRGEAGDTIEAIGIARAGEEMDRADIVLWLGPEGDGPAGAWEIEGRCDAPDHTAKVAPRFRVSAVHGTGLTDLSGALAETGRGMLPKPGESAINRRQRSLVEDAMAAILEAAATHDPLIAGECLRTARHAFDQLLGNTATDDMLDALFGRFCIGK